MAFTARSTVSDRPSSLKGTAAAAVEDMEGNSAESGGESVGAGGANARFFDAFRAGRTLNPPKSRSNWQTRRYLPGFVWKLEDPPSECT
jgi:hypothetical protein